MPGVPVKPPELTCVVRFAPVASQMAPRGVIFRQESSRRRHFSTFAELEQLLVGLLSEQSASAEEEISPQ